MSNRLKQMTYKCLKKFFTLFMASFSYNEKVVKYIPVVCLEYNIILSLFLVQIIIIITLLLLCGTSCKSFFGKANHRHIKFSHSKFIFMITNHFIFGLCCGSGYIFYICIHMLGLLVYDDDTSLQVSH